MPDAENLRAELCRKLAAIDAERKAINLKLDELLTESVSNPPEPPVPPLNEDGIAHALFRLSDYAATVEDPDDPDTSRMETILQGAGISHGARAELFDGLTEQNLFATFPVVLFGMLIARLATEHAVVEGERKRETDEAWEALRRQLEEE